MNLTQIKRLEKLIIATKEAPKEAFDMGVFIHDDKNEPTLCGTPACVFGNYVARRDLQKSFKFEERTQPVTHFAIVNSTGKNTMLFVRAGVEHFGLTSDELRSLFDYDGCNNAGRDRTRAVRYLTKFVNEKKRQYAKDRGFRSWKAFQEAR